MRYFSFLLPLGLLLTGCEPTPDADAPAMPPAFFDLGGYMQGQIDSLANNSVLVEKTIELNGTVESHEMADINFANDLRVFREADINKPAWIEKYAADTQRLSGSHLIIRYTALDSSLQTRSLLVDQDRGQVRRVEIVRRTGTVLSDGRHELWYEAAKGYSVRTVQENRFGDDVDASIEVRWK
ncbi:hypothetical protein [Lewinella sp. W8]|uniref:hypothetical protein n=1 Tax=Lewinella sp. W8 TaxID=2528208 RepID=UPI0010688EA9|nr:hypothetical protein [Lewinella sp. W8]MTB49612.1 hypothetical protein [Lewinella sp. W8]